MPCLSPRWIRVCARCSWPSSRSTSRPRSPSARAPWPAATSAASRPRPSAMPWPISRTWASSRTRTPRPGACPRTRPTASTSMRWARCRGRPRRPARRPRRRRALRRTALDRIELVGLGEDRALAVVVTDTGWVTARALTPRPRPSVEELREIGRTLTRRYRGKTFQAIVEDIERPADPLDPLWTRSGGLLDQIIGLLRDRNLYISGAINLLDHPDLSDVGTRRGLLPAFEEKARLVDLLTRMAEERGVQVLIGGENPVEDMRECSLITSTYTYRGQVLGVLGVVGPRRMPYGDVISLVDETARLVSDSLSRVQRELYLPG